MEEKKQLQFHRSCVEVTLASLSHMNIHWLGMDLS